MTSLPFYFYNVTKPVVNEYVLVIFTEHAENFIRGKLIEYDCDLVMLYSDATKKRTVTSWQNEVPLNQPTTARVDNTDYDNNTVQVSLGYIHNIKNEEEKKLKEKKLQEELFGKNKKLISLVKKLIFEQYNDTDEGNDIKKNTELKNFWNLIYEIDEKRRDDYDEELPSLLDYIIEEINNDDEEINFIISFFEERNYSHLYPRFVELLNKTKEEKPKKIISKIEIISTGSHENTQNIIRKALDKFKFEFEFSLKYNYEKKDNQKDNKKDKSNSDPVYIFESESKDSTYEDHNNFVKFLEEEGKKLEQKTYVRFKKDEIKV